MTGTAVADAPADCWYMAGWAREIADAPLARRIAGHPLLIFRGADGSAAALIDRCPHRFAPLSLGTIEGDRVTCGYHGLTFDRSGACVRNPFADRIPAGATVRAFPVAERDGILWVWMGASADADPAAVPDFAMIRAEGPVRTLYGHTPMRANYQFGTDNLMDLSHIEFVHKGSFAGAGVIFAGEHGIRQEGDRLHSDWWMPGIPAPSHTAGLYPPEMIVDHWLEMRWQAPASMYLQIGSTPAGQPRDGGIIGHQAHILTPETDDATHYFWASTYTNPPGGEDMGPMLATLFGQAFDREDKPMIEAAFANLDGADFWSQRPVSLGIDQGGTRARRLIERRLRPAPQGTPA